MVRISLRMESISNVAGTASPLSAAATAHPRTFIMFGPADVSAMRAAIRDGSTP